MKLKPNWSGRLSFEIEKEDDFKYKDRSSKKFSRKYSIEIEKQGDHTFEAYYPKSLLNQIKLFNVFDEFIYDNSETITKTLFYEVDLYFAFEKILNKRETINSIKKDYQLLEKYISDEEEKEDLKMRMEAICESENRFQRYLLDDVITIHYNYGLGFEPGYYFDLHNESKSKKILKKIFPKSKYILKKANWMRHSFTEEDHIQIEYLKASENITSGFKPDWLQVEDDFGSGEFKIENHPNLTLNHEIYLYNIQNMVLESYAKKFVIDSPIMRKEIKHNIIKVNA